jgi:hypothetical protein
MAEKKSLLEYLSFNEKGMIATIHDTHVKKLLEMGYHYFEDCPSYSEYPNGCPGCIKSKIMIKEFNTLNEEEKDDILQSYSDAYRIISELDKERKEDLLLSLIELGFNYILKDGKYYILVDENTDLLSLRTALSYVQIANRE